MTDENSVAGRLATPELQDKLSKQAELFVSALENQDGDKLFSPDGLANVVVLYNVYRTYLNDDSGDLKAGLDERFFTQLARLTPNAAKAGVLMQLMGIAQNARTAASVEVPDDLSGLDNL